VYSRRRLGNPTLLAVISCMTCCQENGAAHAGNAIKVANAGSTNTIVDTRDLSK
jgi:hypothetical protein